MARSKGLRASIVDASVAVANESGDDTAVLEDDIADSGVDHGADDDQGVEPEAPAVTEPSGDDQVPPEGVEPGQEAPQPQPQDSPYAKPPETWRDDAKGVWAKLPERARREVTRREAQMRDALRDTERVKHEYRQIESALQPYMGRLQEWNASPASVLSEFMNADRVLSSGNPVEAAQFMAKLIKEYGVDINALDSALAGAQMPQQLAIESQIQSLIDQRLRPFTIQQEQQRMAQKQEVANYINAMGSDPKYPYFEEVRQDMADLIEINYRRGIEVSLDEAYNRIVGYRGYKQNRSDAVQRARNASISVSGAPGSTTNTGNPKDLRGTILGAMNGDLEP